MFKEFEIKNDLSKVKYDVKLKLQKSKKKIKNILKIENKTYENFVKPFQEIQENLDEFTTLFFHIDSVKNRVETQNMKKELIPLMSKYNTWLFQNENIYLSLKSIQYNACNIFNVIQNKNNKKNNNVCVLKSRGIEDKCAKNLNKKSIVEEEYISKIIQNNSCYTLSNIQKKVLENLIKDFEFGGCGLDEKNKKELKQIRLKLSKLSNKFSQNILDSTNSFEMIIDDFKDVKEIPQSDLDLAKIEKKEKTKYKFTLHAPSYLSYITYGNNRELRKKIYKAYCTRAKNNKSLIDNILKLRSKKAKILGFKNHAQYSLSTKMAKSENEVVNFLYELANKAKKKAKKEIQDVKSLAIKDGIKKIKSYDLAYYSQKLKKEKYNIDEEYYRPYFEKNSVVVGLFSFLNKIFNIEFKLVKNAKTWDEKVTVYDLYENKIQIARIYLDLEAREDKKSGAWMNNWHSRYKKLDGSLELPTAFIVCNFPPSKKNTHSLLRHDDVTTLFHEIGHGIHHLLSKVDEPFVSGISGVAWDCVEFPSQFLEYFAYDKDILKLFAKHYKTKEVLSDDAIQKLINAKNFQSSIALIRQCEFALFDFKVHQKLYKGKKIQKLIDEIRDEISPLKPPKYNKFQYSFSHIFSGGYSAGYYSYKWAEVLSADAFYLFLKNGVLNKDLASKYKKSILEKGGSANMNELYFEFASREPKVDSLLKIDGIIS